MLQKVVFYLQHDSIKAIIILLRNLSPADIGSCLINGRIFLLPFMVYNNPDYRIVRA